MTEEVRECIERISTLQTQITLYDEIIKESGSLDRDVFDQANRNLEDVKAMLSQQIYIRDTLEEIERLQKEGKSFQAMTLSAKLAFKSRLF